MASSAPAEKKKRGIDEPATANVRVKKIRPLHSPAILIEEMPPSQAMETFVQEARIAIANCLSRKDDRLVVIVGPCSIHDTKAALEYAKELKALADNHVKDFLVVMRVYFEKPRTTVGWKGLINDPDMNGSFNINKGLRLARQLLIDINSLGLPVATEFLDSISPQYTSDLVAWGAIGARTTESQIHRELASGLSCPIGFKNGTGGNVQLAVDAIGSASHPHSFLGLTEQGVAGIVSTAGNPHCHVILRGGSDCVNYKVDDIKKCEEMCGKAGHALGVMVDCSHGNSRKIHTNQPIVAEDISRQLSDGNGFIAGVMIESNIVEGSQSFTPGSTDVASLKYGVSITDSCIDLATTAKVFSVLSDGVTARRKKNSPVSQSAS